MGSIFTFNRRSRQLSSFLLLLIFSAAELTAQQLQWEEPGLEYPGQEPLLYRRDIRLSSNLRYGQRKDESKNRCGKTSESHSSKTIAPRTQL